MCEDRSTTFGVPVEVMDELHSSGQAFYICGEVTHYYAEARKIALANGETHADLYQMDDELQQIHHCRYQVA